MRMCKKLLGLYSGLDRELKDREWKCDWPGESPYEIALGAVLAQNTNWKNAEKAIANLKKENLINERKILKINLRKLELLVRPSGFYRQKAKRVKEMTKTYLKVKEMNDLREMRKILLETHGIGKETADSILLYSLNRPVFVVDRYTKKFCRHFLKQEWKDYEHCREFFEKNLQKDAGLYKCYHALIVEWAKRQTTKAARLRI